MPNIRNSKATRFVCLGMLGAGLASSGYSATDTLITGPLAGNQLRPAVSIGAAGGFVVWQDDQIDGRGWGIALRRLGSNLQTAPQNAVLVNSQKAYDQENPKVACLPDGAGIVVWQGGRRGQRDIYYRKISASGTWLTTETYVNTHRTGEQIAPVVTALPGGDAVVAWTSVNQEGAYKGIFGRRILANSGGSPDQMRLSSPDGREDYSPSLAPLNGGGFVCSWISGSKRHWRQGDALPGDAVVSARVFNNVGMPLSDEVDVSENGGFAASCSVSALNDGFVVAWVDQKTGQAFFRRHGQTGVAIGSALAITNTKSSIGNVAAFADGNVVDFVWADQLATDPKRRVYGREYSFDAGSFSGSAHHLSLAGSSVLQEIEPVVTGDGAGRVIGLWNSYNIGSAFDVMGTQLR
jgi:hypothetical protein